MLTTLCVLAISLTPVASRPAFVGTDPTVSFDLIFEQNSTDVDAEVVLKVKSEEAVDRFLMFGPWPQRPILSLANRDALDLGLSQFVIESAEPSIAQVKAAYPEGPYFAFLRTTSNTWISARTVLSHALPAEPVFTFPVPGQSVPANGAVVTWLPDPAVVNRVVEIEQDELGLSLSVLLPGTVSSFAIPDNYLVSGVEFELGIAAENDLGNLNVVETSFDVQ